VRYVVRVFERQWRDVLGIVLVPGEQLDRDDLRASASELGVSKICWSGRCAKYGEYPRPVPRNPSLPRSVDPVPVAGPLRDVGLESL
jgi:hypothetical protein